MGWSRRTENGACECARRQPRNNFGWSPQAAAKRSNWREEVAIITPRLGSWTPRRGFLPANADGDTAFRGLTRRPFTEGPTFFHQLAGGVATGKVERYEG